MTAVLAPMTALWPTVWQRLPRSIEAIAYAQLSLLC